MSDKIFVIDTNVLLHDPESMTKFPRHKVVIPLTVLEELDKMKRLPNELGKNSRQIVRFLDSLKKIGKGDLHQGVKIENGSVISIATQMETYFSPDFSLAISDNKILMCAYALEKKFGNVVFVSKDFAARVKAEAIGLIAQDYENLKYSYRSIYKGIRKFEITKAEADLFQKDAFITLPTNDLNPNEYCDLTTPENISILGKFNEKKKGVEPLLPLPDIWGITPRNVEQRCAIDAMLRDDIKLVTLLGPAGTGKTLLALACGLRKVFDEAQFNRILVSRPIVPLGRDLGYLPGTKEEKLFNWMQPIYDNLEFLCAVSGSEPNDILQYVLNSKKIEMEAVTYIRGRSLPKMFIIVDEAQNLTPHEVKTIVSRAGEGTKVVLCGDPSQIDNPYLDQDSNGLTYTVAKFSEQDLYAHMYLYKTERSELAAIAADIM
ncbi:MAG: PhoH family protein [Chlamydiales bacterium]